MNILEIVVLGLACWRLTSLLYQEKGPFSVFQKLRERMGITHIDDKPCIYPDKFLCQLFSCVWCLSVWISGLLTVGYIFLPDVTIYFSVWLGLSTITIGLDKWLVAVE
jgi:hypothetical protein